MKVIEAFQIKGNIHDSITAIRVDRNLSGGERARKTAIIGDIDLSVEPTSLENVMWTGDAVEDPKELIGQNVILV